jgi:hypothetical protein
MGYLIFGIVWFLLALTTGYFVGSFCRRFNPEITEEEQQMISQFKNLE